MRCPALARYGPQSTSLSSVSVFTDVCVSRAMMVTHCPQSTSLSSISVFSDACVCVSRAMTVRCPALARYGPQSTSLSSVSVFTDVCVSRAMMVTHCPQSTSLSSISVFSDACVCVSRAMTVRCPALARYGPRSTGPSPAWTRCVTPSPRVRA